MALCPDAAGVSIDCLVPFLSRGQGGAPQGYGSVLFFLFLPLAREAVRAAVQSRPRGSRSLSDSSVQGRRAHRHWAIGSGRAEPGRPSMASGFADRESERGSTSPVHGTALPPPSQRPCQHRSSYGPCTCTTTVSLGPRPSQEKDHASAPSTGALCLVVPVAGPPGVGRVDHGSPTGPLQCRPFVSELGSDRGAWLSDGPRSRSAVRGSARITSPAPLRPIASSAPPPRTAWAASPPRWQMTANGLKRRKPVVRTARAIRKPPHPPPPLLFGGLRFPACAHALRPMFDRSHVSGPLRPACPACRPAARGLASQSQQPRDGPKWAAAAEASPRGCTRTRCSDATQLPSVHIRLCIPLSTYSRPPPLSLACPVESGSSSRKYVCRYIYQRRDRLGNNGTH